MESYSCSISDATSLLHIEGSYSLSFSLLIFLAENLTYITYSLNSMGKSMHIFTCMCIYTHYI